MFLKGNKMPLKGGFWSFYEKVLFKRKKYSEKCMKITKNTFNNAFIKGLKRVFLRFFLLF